MASGKELSLKLTDPSIAAVPTNPSKFVAGLPGGTDGIQAELALGSYPNPPSLPTNSDLTPEIRQGLGVLTGFLREMGESYGLKDFEKGISECNKGNFGAAAVSFGWGGLKAVGEFFGINDLVRAGQCLKDGNVAGAAGLLVLGLSSLATVGTVSIYKGAFKAAAKGLVTEGAEKIGKEVVQELTEKVTREVVDKATDKVVQQTFSQALEAGAREIADSGARTLADAVAKNGSKALTEESIKSAMRESGEKVTADIMQSFGVEKLVKDKTLELLKTLSNASEADVIKILEKQNIANPKAMAKKLRVALGDGTADKILQEELVDGISRELNESVAKGMEKTFKERWTAILRGEGGDQTSEILNKAIVERAKNEGRDVGKLIEESVEAGWKGAREGAEKAVREAVEKGVREAFEEFRKQRRDEDSSSSPGHKRSHTIGPGSVDTGVAFNNLVNFRVPVSSGSDVGAARSNEIGKFSSNLAATMSEASKTGGEAIAKAAELRKENPVEIAAANNIVEGPKLATPYVATTTTTTTAATVPTNTTTTT